MARIAIIGDGPAGLSAALFLAKNGHDTVVHGQDGTPMHHARLLNYLGIDDEDGTDFQRRTREQVQRHGARLLDGAVASVRRDGDVFHLRTDDGEESEVDYLVLAAGKTGGEIAAQLGVGSGPDGVTVDGDQRTDVDRVYAVGRLVRPNRSQAVISAGAGAVAALDILSREAGKDAKDWDTPDQD